MKSQGRPRPAVVTIAFLFSVLAMDSVFAAPLSVRDIEIIGGAEAKVTLDSSPAKGSVGVDFVRDIVQFSLPNTTIYPAKILHAPEVSERAFSKVFAYQYSPNLVRVRFTVGGSAEALKGKVKFDINGKEIRISFPSGPQDSGTSLSESKASALISKVLGQSDSREATSAVAESSKEPKEQKSKNRLGSTPKVVELGGKTHGPSVFRSLLAMFLIVGGLGMVLIYVKKKAGSAQAKRIGDSWLSNILSGGKKQKPFVEVIASHSIGPKQSITIVRIRGQQFVLGVTPDHVQLITQLDSDETDLDVLEDPKIADSIGKMFGSKIKSEPRVNLVPSEESQPTANFNFDSLLKSSTGAGAIVARSAYETQAKAEQGSNAIPQAGVSTGNGVREQIRRRLQQGAERA